jgi:hypothetical protein
MHALVMRKLFVATSLLCSLVVLSSCSLLKKKTDEADAAAAASDEAGAEPATTAAADASEAPPAPAAKNAADVARFQAETKVEDDGAKILTMAAVRAAPRAGATVATLKPGSDVTKVSTYQDAFLVTFADPKDASVTLMGWIGKESFAAVVVTDGGLREGGLDGGAADAGPKDAGPPIADAGHAAVDAGKPALKCAANQVAVLVGAEPSCKKKCAVDKDCAGGAAGACALAAAAAGGKAVRVCVRE